VKTGEGQRWEVRRRNQTSPIGRSEALLAAAGSSRGSLIMIIVGNVHLTISPVKTTR